MNDQISFRTGKGRVKPQAYNLLFRMLLFQATQAGLQTPSSEAEQELTSHRLTNAEHQQPVAPQYMSAMAELRGGMTDAQKQHAILMRKKLQQDLDQQVVQSK